MPRKSKPLIYLLKVEQYDSGTQEGYIGFWMTSANTIEEAKEGVTASFKSTEHYVAGLGEVEVSQSSYYELQKHFTINSVCLAQDNYN